MTAHRNLQRSIVVGFPALVLVASCVPQDRPRTAASRVALKSDAKTLLRQLALDVPEIVVTALPPRPVTSEPLAEPTAAPAFLAEARSQQDFDRAEDCLTAAIYYEARSQTDDGQRAVAQVVLNRVRDLAFPSSVCGVVYQGSTRRTGCQFSFTCDGSMDRRRNPASWEHAREIAAAALGGSVYAPVGSATHYHAAYVSPWWAPSLSRIAQIGAHIFYRWQTGMERALAFRQTYSGIEPGNARGWDGGSAVTIASGAVRYGDETVLGVTVHRGSAPETAQVAARETTQDRAPESIPSPRLVRTSLSVGVRVHYGKVTPTIAAGADDTGDGEDGGTI